MHGFLCVTSIASGNMAYARPKIPVEGIVLPDYIHDIRQLVGHQKMILVVAAALIFDAHGRLLLQQRRDNRTWGIPGGFMEIGETIHDTARREVQEEVGLRLKDMSLFAVYSGPEHETTLANGDQVAHVLFVFTCREYQGSLLNESEESLATGFFPLNALPDPLFKAQRYIFRDLLSKKPRPIFD